MAERNLTMARNDRQRGQEQGVTLTHPKTGHVAVAYQDSVRQKFEARGYEATADTKPVRKSTKKTTAKK